MIVNGNSYQAGGAEQSEAALHLIGNTYRLVIQEGDTYSGEINDLKISNRLGNIERKITLKNGIVFSTQQNDEIDLWLKEQRFEGQSKLAALIHTLESNMALILVALVLTVITSFSILKWGVPWVGNKVAHALPHKTNEIISSNTLEFLDNYFFDETKLKPARRNQIEVRFKELVKLSKSDPEIKYNLHFRSWGAGDTAVANAFALPSGDIVLTDRFVEISQNQDQIDAVLLHEIGHVVKRHTLEIIVESTLLTTIIMLATGDASMVADMGIGLGSLLVASSYTRGHESEADDYAFKKMLEANIDPIAFANIMQRMTDDMERKADKKNNKKDQQATPAQVQKEPSNDTNQKTVFDYISSHPMTSARIKEAKRYSECFKNKSPCN